MTKMSGENAAHGKFMSAKWGQSDPLSTRCVRWW